MKARAACRGVAAHRQFSTKQASEAPGEGKIESHAFVVPRAGHARLSERLK